MMSPLYAALRDHREQLWQTCRRLTGDDGAAEDLMQETLLRVLLHPPPRLDLPLGPWLRRVARNLAIDGYRRAAIASRREIEPPQGSEAIGARRLAAQQETGDAVLAAIEALTPGQRSVLLLRELLDLSVAETASALGLSESNVKVTLHRARKAIATWSTSPRDPTAERAHLRTFAQSLLDRDLRRLRDLVALGAPTGMLADAQDQEFAARDSREAWTTLLGGVVEAARDDPRILVPALWARAGALLAEGRLEEADLDARRARDLAEASGRGDLGTVLALRESKIALQVGGAEALQRAADVLSDLDEECDTAAADIQGRLASGLWRRGRPEDARAIFEDLLVRFEDPGARHAMRANVALMEAMQGNLAAALESADEAIAGLRAAGVMELQANALNAKGMALQNAGRLSEAEGCFAEAVDVLRPLGVEGTEARLLNNLALVRHEQGRLDEAERLLRRAAASHARVGAIRSEAIATANLGVALHAAGRATDAASHLERAVVMLTGVGADDLEGFVRAHLAAAIAAWDPVGAASLLAQARALLEGSQVRRLLDVHDALAAVVDVSEAERHARHERFEAATRAIHRARERVERLTVAGPLAPAAELAAVRIAVDLARRAMARLALVKAPAPSDEGRR